ncbi:MAG: FAD-dependent oxidoreductase [Acidobacteriota bacterium]
MSTRSETLDLLVVGGGPGGTAAAFRAAEHGLRVLVIDYDDLMKRIRDYSKAKLILPGFGGGDTMAFPKGGELISALAFDPIDKDEMCQRWKQLYREHGVASRTGIELTDLEAAADGAWVARTWDHGQRCDGEIRARQVVLAIGRGVPRRFDIPGDTDGICFRLDAAERYLGEVACVIGGGTSAAEAVIALSNAKAADGDPSAVYWSYRGDRMPRVSKALAEQFFSAYVGNGNIRYFPKSEPAGVVVAGDREEYLAIRTDRRVISGRPHETTHLEFPKDRVIACIGEDIPETLLSNLGSPLVCGGPRGRKRMVVNRFLETCQPGIFVVGDLLSQAYFETDDFAGDPAAFREVKHRGNIKSALRDGVLVADVIEARRSGRDASAVVVEDAPEADRSAAIAVATTPDGPPQDSFEADRAVNEHAVLVRLLPGGLEGEEFALGRAGVTTIGRSGCDASFPNDTALSAQHASIAYGEGGFTLRDDGGATGLFLELPAADKRQLRVGDLLRCGQQFLRLDSLGDQPSFSHFDGRGHQLGHHALDAGTTVVGRRAPDITLDPEDRTLSRRHLALVVENGTVLAKDLKSANGSFLRVRDALPLRHGDRFRAGHQRFMISLQEDGVLATGGEETTAPPPSPPPAAGGEGPQVTFQGLGVTVAVTPHQTLCDAAEAAGLPITAECHAGICGSDPLRIVTGHENLASEPDDQEIETLEEICELQPGECRLACKLRITGPVTVEIL